ncbi:hypothetical protein FSARC_13966 [Fusarium sarcochroum]|uniref:DUF6546 domain-containing protein n=1 Tax=Fusarium sarcochroum TaxID=1208366 RepID=A0A8H4WQT0_9HYPO|nr:hypothetical protein FSARC_13966 [Fusarium sarcochroum]
MAASWKSLPPEIRLLTLRCIIPQYGIKETTTHRGFPRASLLATVSKEWQDFFERETFRRMDLEATDLFTFSRTILGQNVVRLNYITNILLTIKLATYTRRIANKPESSTTVTQNNRTFTQAMAVLLKTLSSWEGHSGGLTIEIRAHSPSDQEFHGDLFELYDDYPLRFEDDPHMRTTFFKFCRGNRRRHTPIRVIRRSLDILGLTKRLHGAPLELKPSLVKKRHFCSKTIRNLPETPIVKGLILRYVSRKSIVVKALATLFRESFVALESFHFARWKSWTEEQEKAFLNDLQGDLIPAFPASLKHFVFHIHRDYGGYSLDPSHRNELPLSKLLANTCHRLTQFCLPHDRFTDRLWFFFELGRGGRREDSKLQHLVFRTRYLCHRAHQEGVTECLCFIGEAAKNLPNLRTLELWDAGDGFGCLFRCTLDYSGVTITWRCTDERFTLQERAVRQWAQLASNREFNVRRIPLTKTMEANKKFKLSTILPALHLRQLNFDPISEAHVVIAEKMKVGR